MTNKKQWEKVRQFEDAYNGKLLRKMSAQESFKLLTTLCEVGCALAGKKYWSAVNSDHLSNIITMKSRLKALTE